MMQVHLLSLLPVPFLILVAGAAHAQAAASLPMHPVQVSIQRVVDGDTIHVRLPDDVHVEGLGRGSNVKVRIHGIDAPERCQAWGRESTKALRQMLPVGSTAQLTMRGTDRYGRVLADVHVGASDVGATMVATGNAWNWIDKKTGGRYANEEMDARKSSTGLWHDGNAVRPRDFRKEHEPCK